ncbi:hypothetical protein V1264_019011 [Littorina saxatilis]|uniref:Lipocalin/cytosolic fatty-acid binding domain-containing protein n=2 Tax=Littorina saxatilis TaxID=31220 RepID=A0AAN9BDU2_9CAEN
MFYICHGDVTQQQLCTRATALLAGRQFNVTAARNWLNSVSTSLPCFTGAPIVVQEGAECPLKPFWNIPGRDCDVRSFPVQGNFDLNKYIAKTWYEMTWLAPEYIDPIYYYQDYQHEYEMQPNNSIIVRVSGRNEKKECFFENVSLTTTSTPGKLTWHDVSADVPYNVIQTDYDHYAMVFGCYNMTSSGMCKKARGWLWSRGKTLDRRYRLAAHSKMQDLCLNPAAFFPTEHKNECVRDTGGSTSLRALVVLTAAMLIFVVSLTT